MVQIPFRYNFLRKEKYLMLSDINDGMTICRRLGYDPVKMIVGKREAKELTMFNHPFDWISTEATGKPGVLLFVCKLWKRVKWEMPVTKINLDSRQI